MTRPWTAFVRTVAMFLWQNVRRGGPLILVLVAFLVGFLAHRSLGPVAPTKRHAHPQKNAAWTCSMHPQIQQPRPGKCPLCGMDLIPATSGGGGGGAHPRELKLSPNAVILAEIQVTRVLRRQAATEVRVVGKVAYDERRVGTITAWVDGRIDRLHVNYTGARVKRWQPLVTLYSPELVTAQMELLQAIRLAREMKTSSVGAAAQTTLRAAREKLRLLGMTPGQITKIEKRGKPVDRLTIYAPVGGVVIEKRAKEQMYVKRGTRLFTIADLRQVWVKLDVYESELGRVKKGQTVTFETEAYPGDPFTGTVDFIDPFVSSRTRTVKVRLTVKNPDGRLKPDMFVRAVLQSPVGPDGRTLAVKKAAGKQPLVIPSSAVLFTGTRSVVYVRSGPGMFRGRQVVLGPRVGRYYVVRKGLKQGEQVVTHGAFKIDSALQILARPSMMNPPKKRPEPVPAKLTRLSAPASFQAQLDQVVKAYFGVHHGLSRDALDKAQTAAARLDSALSNVDKRLLQGQARQVWEKQRVILSQRITALRQATEIKIGRRHFSPLSNALIIAILRFGLPEKRTAIRFRCTMAFGNQGADWLQGYRGVENPYFGSQMYRCGDELGVLGRRGG